MACKIVRPQKFVAQHYEVNQKSNSFNFIYIIDDTRKKYNYIALSVTSTSCFYWIHILIHMPHGRVNDWNEHECKPKNVWFHL